jgi:hypothetical protein
MSGNCWPIERVGGNHAAINSPRGILRHSLPPEGLTVALSQATLPAGHHMALT